MTARRAGLALLVVLPLALPTRPAVSQAQAEVVVDDLEFPAGIAFLPDGRMLVNERAGRVRLVEDGRLARQPVAEVPTRTSGEEGLLGIAVAPDGEAAYVFATAADGGENVVWRIPLGGGSPEPVITGLPAGGYHNGGGVAFDEDGMLLVSNGEEHEPERSQDPNVLGGKVYRFSPDGDVPDDNPFPGSPALAIGLRNPFGLTVDPLTGSAWVTENGPSAWDEVNRIVPRGNYGWPEVSGPGDGSDLEGEYQDPVLAYENIIVPVGITFAPEDAPDRYAGDLFFGAYADGTIHRVRLNDARDGAISDQVILRDEEPIVAVAWGPDGLYYSTPSAVKLMRIAAQQDDRPGTSEPTSSPTPAGSPTPSGQGREEGGGGGPLVIALVVAALAGALILTRRNLTR